ncbi:putative integrase/recombinase y4rC [Verrucomicrobia bacterium]|nr:putative integrase/recombinase y4rC [Verrucomicrobiota bacterium]
MKPDPDFAPLCQSFFSKWLMAQRRASPHTISAYAQTFRLLTAYAQKRLRTAPSKLSLAQVDATFIVEFLDDLESGRSNGARSRNARLAALRSFYHYAALEAPQHAGLIQRVLAVPYKRLTRRLVTYLSRAEVEAVLGSVDKSTWIGRRNHAMLLVAVQTGLRLSELTGLRQRDAVLTAGAHVRCEGKGRKERCTPLAKPTIAVLKPWIKELGGDESGFLFPSSNGRRLSADAVQHALAKHVTAAERTCPSLVKKRVTPHVLRHTAAMELLQAGVDRALIAIWLGHEALESTQVYLDADLPLKEAILAKMNPPQSKPGGYRPGDQLLNYLKAL